VSFIPQRDVFSLTDEEINRLDEVYDEIESQYLDDWARDEYGPGWTHQDAMLENGGQWVGPMSISGYDMLVYMYDRMKAAQERQ
jgi:hypothetical protein